MDTSKVPGDRRPPESGPFGPRLDSKFVLEHAQPIRLAASGVCQVLAFLLLISSSGIVYGNREMFIVILMLAATALASISLYRFLRPSPADAEPAQDHQSSG
jgi:hypothetical protein